MTMFPPIARAAGTMPPDDAETAARPAACVRAGVMRWLAACAAVLACVAAGCRTVDPATGAGVPSGRGPCTLVVRLSGLDPRMQTGTVPVAVWGSAEAFMKDGRWTAARNLPVAESGAPVVFEGLPAGPCAVSAFHDVTSCGHFRRSLLGLPIDPWAVSGGASPFAPPVWEKAAFELRPGENEVTLEFVTSAGRKP